MKWTSPLTGTPALCLAAWLGLGAVSQAALLVYEGFSYGSTGMALSGVEATGLGLDGSYTVNTSFNGTGTGSVNYTTSALTFGSNFLATTGGAISISVTGQNGTNNASIAALVPLALGEEPTGTLYTSFLFNFTTLHSNDGAGAGVTVNNGTNYFQTVAEANFNSAAANRKPGVGYDTSINANYSGGSLSQGVTYLAVARYTNTGTSLSAGTPGVATLWIFNQSQYDSWYNAGALEANLSGSALGTASETLTSGSFSLASGNSLRFFDTSGTNGSAGTQSLRMDEVRWGTTLGDVVLIPEPSAALLLFLAILLHALKRTRNLATQK
jgi:hypothetical protein